VNSLINLYFSKVFCPMSIWWEVTFAMAFTTHVCIPSM
jgi:hypothetical protein